MKQYYDPNMKMADFYAKIDCSLRIAPDTMKKLLRRTTTTISREMLCKIAVGTGMGPDTANSFFTVSKGNTLRPDSLSDRIVINALRNHDSGVSSRTDICCLSRRRTHSAITHH